MTPAEQATANAISFECKKDALQQRQSGDWKISFTVQGVDMDDRLTRAAMGTRFVAVLVEVNDDELPINQPKKGVKTFTATIPATPRQEDKPAGAKPERLGYDKQAAWRDVLPAAQSGIRCGEPTFWAFLREVHNVQVNNRQDAEPAVREICGVHSRVEFSTDHRKHVLWHQLDTEYQAWLAMERVGA